MGWQGSRCLGGGVLLVYLLGSIVFGDGPGTFFSSLEYGRPIRGVTIPFRWIDASWEDGKIEIEEASIEPGGSGMWKLATRPDLILKGVTVRGPAEHAGKAIRAISPKGAMQLKILHFTYMPTPGRKSLYLEEVVVAQGRTTVIRTTGDSAFMKTIVEIFGKDVIYQKE